MPSSLKEQSERIVRSLREFDVKFALIGGIAVSYRSVERNTKDIDLAVSVESDVEAEALVRSLTANGYRIQTVIEHENASRLSTVRVLSYGGDEMFVDLLFASSGIEPEIVANVDDIEVFPGVSVPVASTASLIALKVLSADDRRRLKDIIDLQNLLERASPADLIRVRELLNLITERGFNRNKNLQEDLDRYIERFSE